MGNLWFPVDFPLSQPIEHVNVYLCSMIQWFQWHKLVFTIYHRFIWPGCLWLIIFTENRPSEACRLRLNLRWCPLTSQNSKLGTLSTVKGTSFVDGPPKEGCWCRGTMVVIVLHWTVGPSINISMFGCLFWSGSHGTRVPPVSLCLGCFKLTGFPLWVCSQLEMERWTGHAARGSLPLTWGQGYHCWLLAVGRQIGHPSLKMSFSMFLLLVGSESRRFSELEIERLCPGHCKNHAGRLPFFNASDFFKINTRTLGANLMQ